MIGYRTSAVPQQNSWTQSQTDLERQRELLNRDWTRPTGAVPGVEDRPAHRPARIARIVQKEQPPLLTVEGYGYRGTPLSVPPQESCHCVLGVEDMQGISTRSRSAGPGQPTTARQAPLERKDEDPAAELAEQARMERRKAARKQQQASRAMRLLTMLPLAACAVQRLFIEAFQDVRQSMTQNMPQSMGQHVQEAAAPAERQQAAPKPSFSACAPGY